MLNDRAQQARLDYPDKHRNHYNAWCDNLLQEVAAMGFGTSADAWRMPDDLWAKIQPLLPVHVNTHPFGGGKRRRADRDCLDAILYRLRTGCPWKALEAKGLCPGSTAHDRFQEWIKAGVFFAFWKQGLLEYDCFEGIDWDWLTMHERMTKAPPRGERRAKTPRIVPNKAPSAAN